MQPSLRFEDLDRFKLACPPEKEQQSIVDHLAQALQPTNGSIHRARREIDLIREYRTRLIADVVTGKLDVRDFAPPETAAGDDITEAEDLDDGIDEEMMQGDDEPEFVEESSDD